MRAEYDCFYLSASMFQMDWLSKCFKFNHCYDPLGRPIFWCRFEHFQPVANTEREVVRFLCYTMDNVAYNMKPNVDQYVMVYDFNNTGYSNFSKSHTQDILKFLQIVYCDRQYKTFIMRLPWIANGIKSVVMPFLHPRTAAKFNFLSSDWKERLLQEFGADNLPQEYGGNREN